MVDAVKLIKTLQYECGLSVRSYSGRGMYGNGRCVGVDLVSSSELWDLAFQLGALGEFGDVPAPKTDSMGRGIIAYWPWIEWPEAEIGPDTQSEDEDEDEE